MSHFPEKMLEIIGDYDAVITRSGTPLTADVFAAGKRLKVAGRAGLLMSFIRNLPPARRDVPSGHPGFHGR